MSGLIDNIEEVAGSGIFVPSALRFTNQIGTPLASVVVTGALARLIGGVYALTFTNVTPGVSANVTVQAASPNNPSNGGPIAVNLDNTTVYTNIIQGVSIVFSNSVGFLSVWQGQIRIGLDQGAFNAFGATAGVPGTQRRHRVQNTGAGPGLSCIAGIRPCAQLWAKTLPIIFADIPVQFASTLTPKLSSSGQVVPYVVTVANVSGSGAGKTMDLKVDGATVSVTDNLTGVTASSTGLNVLDTYTVASGALAGLQFVLSQAAVNTSVENLLVFPAPPIQIAPDLTGAPGVWGIGDVVLGSGGVIPASGTADFWERPLVPAGFNSISNPFITSVMLQGAASQAAGWGN